MTTGTPQPLDLLVTCGTLLTMNGTMDLSGKRRDRDREGRIAFVRTAGEDLPDARERLDATGLPSPGLVNTQPTPPWSVSGASPTTCP
jgi:hypothetical protein